MPQVLAARSFLVAGFDTCLVPRGVSCDMMKLLWVDELIIFWGEGVFRRGHFRSWQSCIEQTNKQIFIVLQIHQLSRKRQLHASLKRFKDACSCIEQIIHHLLRERVLSERTFPIITKMLGADEGAALYGITDRSTFEQKRVLKKRLNYQFWTSCIEQTKEQLFMIGPCQPVYRSFQFCICILIL